MGKVDQEIMDAAEVIRQHERSGRRFTAGGVGSFVLDQGSGETVVCLHGVPASAFLNRKVIKELADRGLRGVAFDLPGLGLADRPDNFDYTWTGLGRFANSAVDVAFAGCRRHDQDQQRGVGRLSGSTPSGGRRPRFLKIMRGFERTPAKRQRYTAVLRSGRYPVQIVWGEADPALRIRVDGERARRAAGLDQIHRLPAKHFLQGDQAPALADLVAKLVRA